MERSLLCAFILIKKDESLESKEVNKTFFYEWWREYHKGSL